MIDRSRLALSILSTLAFAACARSVHGEPTARATAALLAATPPMGWNSWNRFGCNVSDKLVREIADAMVSSGMKEAGYEYVIIDDCWQAERHTDGNIVADARRFPAGMKALADYVHRKGLKFGVYSDAGSKTCGGRPGSKGHEVRDAKLYASWGVDYLKYDWCFTEGQDAREAYQKMGRALRDTGRPIVFSLCEWGQSKPWTWAPGVGQLWRTTGDIQDCWDCSKEWGGMGVTHIIDSNESLYAHAGPGHWNDPDMLEVGNGGMTTSEYRAHFSFWALLAAPLIAGNDIRRMSPETRAILMNREVIAIDQDPLGVQGRRVRDDGPYEVWSKPLAQGERAVILFNRGDVEAKIAFTWEEVGYAGSSRAKLRDLWAGKDLGEFAKEHSAKVPPHDVLMLRMGVVPADP